MKRTLLAEGEFSGEGVGQDNIVVPLIGKNPVEVSFIYGKKGRLVFEDFEDKEPKYVKLEEEQKHTLEGAVDEASKLLTVLLTGQETHYQIIVWPAKSGKCFRGSGETR